MHHSNTCSSKPVKYISVTRKKSERAKLKAIDCNECRDVRALPLPPSIYSSLPINDEKKHEGDLKDTRSDEELLKARKQHVSRHRYKFIPEDEPSGFWDLNYSSRRP
nr:14590_t:CDS:2 [Entrophospora candida]CAG8600800.1 1393_t:CDS:2 [Entrophospora candida]